MFGLEETKKKKKKESFAFDLEADIHKDPEKGKEYIAKSEKQIEFLKKTLREGAKSEDIDNYGVLLHGYAALIRVLKKILKQKKTNK